MNFKGQNRRMFRKPGAAKRALGILASSQELANTVEPMRMANGGVALSDVSDMMETLVEKDVDRLNRFGAAGENVRKGLPRSVGAYRASRMFAQDIPRRYGFDIRDLEGFTDERGFGIRNMGLGPDSSKEEQDRMKAFLMNRKLAGLLSLLPRVKDRTSEKNPEDQKAIDKILLEALMEASQNPSEDNQAFYPIRMANGGLAEIEQVKAEIADAQRDFNEALTFRNTIARDNALSSAQQRIERANQRLAELRETVGRDAQARARAAAEQTGIVYGIDGNRDPRTDGLTGAVSSVLSKTFETPEKIKLFEEAADLLSQIEIEPGDSAAEVGGKLIAKFGIAPIKALEIASSVPYLTGQLLAQDLGTPAREAIDYSVDKIKGAGAALQESGFVPAAQAAAESVAEDPIGTIRRAGATFGEKLFGLPQEAERKAAVEGSKLKAAQAAMVKSVQEQLKKGKEETAGDADPLQSGLDKLAAESIEGKGRKNNDLLVRIGLNIMAGTDPNALTNIAKGTLAGLDSYRNEELVREKMAPDIIKTLKSLKSAGLDEAQQNAVLQYLILPRDKTTGPERLVREGLAAAQAGDYITAQAKFEAGGVDSADLLIEDIMKRQQQAQAPAASAQEDKGSSFFPNFLR